MSLVRWEPFREIDSMQREMNRLFDQLTTLPQQGSLSHAFGGSFVPSVALEETDEAVLLKLEVPGLKPEDLDVEVTADSVSIRGERRSETNTEARAEARAEASGYSRTEFRYGTFHRVIPLPTPVQNTEVTAHYQDGILSLTLPKTEDERNKVVRVAVN